MTSLAERQAALVAALVAGAAPPPGFDPVRVQATAEALLRKRAGEVGERWPWLRLQFGPQWNNTFADWARGRPPRGSLRDGFDFARQSSLTGLAAVELAMVEARYRYDGVNPPRLRRAPAVRRFPGGLVVQAAGRVRVMRVDHGRGATR
jgi:hypothetical protein